MVKKLLAEQLLLKDRSVGYILTDLGLKLVSDLYRKHRLIEVFLVHHLDYTSDQIHEEAEVLAILSGLRRALPDADSPHTNA